MGYVVPIRDDHELDCELDFEAFYITAQQVKDAANFLNALDDNTLENMYDLQSMKENAVYPLYGNETEADAEFLYEYLYSYLIKLREYFNQTAEKGYAIILYFSERKTWRKPGENARPLCVFAAAHSAGCFTGPAWPFSMGISQPLISTPSTWSQSTGCSNCQRQVLSSGETKAPCPLPRICPPSFR